MDLVFRLSPAEEGGLRVLDLLRFLLKELDPLGDRSTLWTSRSFLRWCLDERLGDIHSCATSMGLEPTLSQYYGINSFDDLYTPEIIEYRQKVDLIGLMDSEDPDIYLRNANQPDWVPLTSSQFLHHPVHAQLVYDYANSNSIDNVTYVPMLSIEDPSGQSIIEFFAQQLID